MKIDIWSDMVCPFCTLGRARLDAALQRFEHRDDVEIAWHSFILDPDITPGGEKLTERVARRHGEAPEAMAARTTAIADAASAEGLRFDWQHAVMAPTADAHRLAQYAKSFGPDVADAFERAVMRAFFSDGKVIDDPEVLVEAAVASGMDEDGTRRVLVTAEYADAVAADLRAAAQIGIRGVPFFVFGERYAVSGAQPVEVFEEALARTWAETTPAYEPLSAAAAPDGSADATGAAACGPDGCAVPQARD